VKVSQVYVSNSDWLKAADLSGPTDVTIVGVEMHTFDSKDEHGNVKKKDQLVLLFDGWDKKLGLNATNATTIAAQLGDDTDYWVNHTITLYVDPRVKTPTGYTAGIRIMPVLPGAIGQGKPRGAGPAPSVAGAVKGIVARQGGRPTPPPQQAYEGPEEEYDPLG
jgi:hypothetical protein